MGSLQGETVSSGNQIHCRQLHSSFYPQFLHINLPEHKMVIFFSRVRKCQKLTEICLLKWSVSLLSEVAQFISAHSLETRKPIVCNATLSSVTK